MALDYRFDIKLVVENALYEYTTDNMTLKEIEEKIKIGKETRDKFIKEKKMKKLTVSS